LYFVKGKFGGKKFTLQKSESTLQRSFCHFILDQAWAKHAPNMKFAPALQLLLFAIMIWGLLCMTDKGWPGEPNEKFRCS
jgi:hypothetical protein